MKICIFGASSDAIGEEYIKTAEEMGRLIAEREHCLLFGGGAHGVMGGAARGVLSAGGTVIGIAPRFFDHEGVLEINCTQMIFTDTMGERKAALEEQADGFMMLPGGIGTFDEFFDMLTLKQLGRINKPLAILNVNGYFEPLLALLQNAVDQSFMDGECLWLYRVFSDPKELLDYLETATEHN